MIQKPLIAYSVLNYIWSKDQDILDTYIPLVCSCILKNNLQEVTRNDIEHWFLQEYGLNNLTKGACESIIRRMIKIGYLKNENHKYLVIQDKIVEYVENAKTIEHADTDFSYLIAAIIKYANDKYSLHFTNDEVEQAILDFLQSHDGDLLLQEEKLVDILEKQKQGKTNKTKLKFIISKFLLQSQEQDRVSLEKMVNLAKGHILSSLLSMKDFSAYQGKLNNVIIALDTPIIYSILGLNDKANIELMRELISRLKDLGAQFIIFEQNYNEVHNTLNSTTYLLRTKNYDLEHSSRLLRYAVRRNISADKLQMYLHQLDDTLTQWQITREVAPNNITNYQEIDVEKLTELISNIYNNKGETDLQEYQKELINTDVDTISYIFRMRGNVAATSLKNCKAILLTTNAAIAYASRYPKLSNIVHAIPVCMTDIFLSTILWMNFPSKNTALNERLLMSECSRNITLDDKILQRFYADVVQMHEQNLITEEQVLLANTSKLTIKLLENKTFNDESLYTDTTTEEILQEMELTRNRENKDLKGKLNRHDNNIKRFANILAYACYWLVWGVLIVIFLIKNYIDISTWKCVWKIAFKVLFIVPALWGLCSHAGVIPSKINFINKIANFFYEKINLLLEKE